MRVQLAQQAQEILGQSDLVIITERVDDVALLIGQRVTMGLPEVLNQPCHQRGSALGGASPAANRGLGGRGSPATPLWFQCLTAAQSWRDSHRLRSPSCPSALAPYGIGQGCRAPGHDPRLPLTSEHGRIRFLRQSGGCPLAVHWHVYVLCFNKLSRSANGL